MITQQIEKYEVNDNNYNDFCLPQQFLKGIYDIVKFTKQLFERENIEYFIDGGTLLGCVRDGGQILYDNDADFGITPINFKKIVQFKNEFEKENFSFIITNDKIQLINENIFYIQNQLRISPALDILVYNFVKENQISKLMIKDIRYKKEYPNAWYYKKHLYPLKDYTYRCCDEEPLILKGARDPNNYLNGTYPNWKTIKIFDYKIYNIE